MLLTCLAIQCAPVSASDQAQVVQRATDVVEQWSDQQHLYVKGDVGVSRERLDELEQWLDKNGPHWTVVLMRDSSGERYRSIDGRSYSGMDAVEQALGRGLSNKTGFGLLEDSRTGETDGTVFVLSLADRAFSYFASDAQDRRGLGESHWRGRLDRPAYRAMASGRRVVDAVKDTVTSINRGLDRAITAEEEARRSRERELQRARLRTEQLAERASVALEQVAQLSSQFRDQYPDAEGELAFPPLDEWQDQLDEILEQVSTPDVRAASQRAATLVDEIEGLTVAYQAHAGFPDQFAEWEERVRKANVGPGEIAAPTIAAAQAKLNEAVQMRDNGDRQWTQALDAVGQLLSQAQQEVAAEQERIEARLRRQRLVRSALLAALVGATVCLAIVLFILNRRREPVRDRAVKRLQERSSQVQNTSDGMLGLLERTQVLIGAEQDLDKRGTTGRSLEVSKQTINDVDRLFIMSRTIDRQLEEIKQLIEPVSPWGRVLNLFGQSNYAQAIEILDERRLTFTPEDGIKLLAEEGQQGATPLGNINDQEHFDLTFEELLQQYRSRYERAKTSLDSLEDCWSNLIPMLEQLQTKIQTLGEGDQRLAELAEQDGWFPLPGCLDVLLPAIQQAHDDAESTGVSDPLTAIHETLARGHRQADEADSLLNAISSFRETQLPGVLGRAKDLEGEGREIQWVHDFLKQLGEQADELARQIADESKASAVEELQGQLTDLAERTSKCLELHQQLRGPSAEHVQQTKNQVVQARSELADQLQQPVTQVLHEADRDPDLSIQAAERQLASAEAALDRGAVLPGQAAIDEAEMLLQTAQGFVVTTQEQFQQQPDWRARLSDRFSDVSRNLTSAVGIIEALRSEFVPEVLVLSEARPGFAAWDSEPSSDDVAPSLGDHQRRVKELLERSQHEIDRAESLRQGGRILEAADRLAESEQALEYVAGLCQQVEQLRSDLKQLQLTNQRSYSDLEGRLEHLRGEAKDPRTQQRTIETSERCSRLLQQANSQLMGPRRVSEPA